ncbi:MAG: DUF2089 domain-containing protein [Clostridia bacterium]|nr:DUF2089 domain-containing protein [Clostridia bacterium]
MYKRPDRCCTCGGELSITKLKCSTCHTEISGEFSGCRFCGLSQEMSDYLLVFLKCRGNIKEIEKELGVSYPTVRNYTDSLLVALGLSEKTENQPLSKASVLRMLERKEISVAEAAHMIRDLEG